MDQPRFLTQFHHLFWATQSPIINHSLISFSSSFKGSPWLFAARLPVQYTFPRKALFGLLESFNSQQSQSHSYSASVWHSRTIQPCLSESHLQIKQTLPPNTSLHVGDMVLPFKGHRVSGTGSFLCSLVAGRILKSEVNCRVLKVTFLVSQITGAD